MNSKSILALYNQEKSAQLVNKETFALIDKALECQSELSAIEVGEVFVEGFSLAISLVLEAMSNK